MNASKLCATRDGPKRAADDARCEGKTMKTNLILCGALALVSGCMTPTPDVTSHYDDVSGLRTDLMGENLLETPGEPRELVWLNASRVFKTYEKAVYYLEVNYMAKQEVGYLEIPPGETLTVIVDGEAMKFDGTGSQNMRKPYKKELVRENAIYPCTKVQIQKIADAKEVKVRIKGNKGLIERDFSPVNFDRVRKFAASYAR